MKHVNNFERENFAVLPTPMYKLKNISKKYGCNVYIKRDDMTGVSLGGNKVRKLEFLLADAKAKGADYVITTGGAQSNHAMLTAACANRIGMKAILVLQQRGVCERKGNLILNDILGADVRFVDSDDFKDVYDEIHRIAEELKGQGHLAYEIPLGGSVPLGSIGYVHCMKEVAKQAQELDVEFKEIICTTGSGGTHAGVTLGAHLYMPHAKVTGMMVSPSPFEKIVPKLIRGTGELLEVEEADIEEAVGKVNLVPVWGDGYAIPSKEGNAAMEMLATNEAIIVDPVYTGKAFGGLISMLESGQFSKDDNILFLHTGGAGGVFALY